MFTWWSERVHFRAEFHATSGKGKQTVIGKPLLGQTKLLLKPDHLQQKWSSGTQ